MVKSTYRFTQTCIDLWHAAHLCNYVPLKFESQIGFYNIQTSDVLQTATKCMKNLKFWIYN